MSKCIDITHKEPLAHQIHVNAVGEIPDGSCDEIILNDTLDYIADRDAAFAAIAAKLKYGGSISVEGNDIVEWCRNITIANKNLSDINNSLYGKRASISDLNVMVDLLHSFGFEIIYRRLMATTYSIKAQRPNAKT